MRHLFSVAAIAALSVLAAEPAAAFTLGGPPRPRVIASDGAQERAARGSYCWDDRHSARLRRHERPDGLRPDPEGPGGSSQVVRMRHEVTSLTASNRRGKRFQLEPLGDGGRRFRLTIDHPSAPHPTAIYLFARYGDAGDGSFAIKLKPHAR